MKYLYKYPQEAFPYETLVEENNSPHRSEPEFDLIDTGAFDDDRYFDIFVEYGKARGCVFTHRAHARSLR